MSRESPIWPGISRTPEIHIKIVRIERARQAPDQPEQIRAVFQVGRDLPLEIPIWLPVGTPHEKVHHWARGILADFAENLAISTEEYLLKDDDLEQVVRLLRESDKRSRG